jgi:bifunctional ADP-heptose synthase (sugar kinase/adenylyltransferase)
VCVLTKENEMKELIRGVLVCVFMLNIVYVHEQQSKKDMVKIENEYAARRARMYEVNKELIRMQIEHETNKEEEQEPVLAGY